MSAIALINEWLKSGQDYAQGCALYNQLGSNQSLKRLFAMGESIYARSKLLEEISAAYQALSGSPLSASPEKGTIPGHTRIPSPFNSNPEIEQLRVKRLTLFKETSYLHSQLVPAPNPEARLKLALQIRKNWAEIDRLWEQQHYAEQHGELPKATAPIIVTTDDPVKLMERRRNLMTYITKHQRNPEKAAKVAAWRAERAEIERRLNLG